MMFDPLYKIFADDFTQFRKDGKDEWCLVGLAVPVALLSNLYQMFLKDNIDPLEKLSPEKKLIYYNIACKYYDKSDTKKIIAASKSAYVLELITDTF